MSYSEKNNHSKGKKTNRAIEITAYTATLTVIEQRITEHTGTEYQLQLFKKQKQQLEQKLAELEKEQAEFHAGNGLSANYNRQKVQRIEQKKKGIQKELDKKQKLKVKLEACPTFPYE